MSDKYDYYEREIAQLEFRKLLKNYRKYYKNHPEKKRKYNKAPSNSKDPFWKEIVDEIKAHISNDFQYAGASVFKYFLANVSKDFPRNFKVSDIEYLKELILFYEKNVYNPKSQKAIPIKLLRTEFRRQIGFSLLLLLSLILLGIGKSYTALQPEHFITSSINVDPQCIFNPNDSLYKILVLPFKDINGNSNRNDIGYVIERRLDSISKADNLKISVKYCEGVILKDNNEEYYDTIRKMNNADHIIYGFSEGGCNSAINKVCVNYISNLDFNEVLLKNVSNSFGNFKSVELEDLNKGTLQYDTDYLLYYNAMIGSLKLHQYEDVIKFGKDLLKIKGPEENSAYFYMGVSYHNLFRLDLSNIYLKKAIEYDTEFSWRSKHRLGTNYLRMGEYSLAKEYLYGSKEELKSVEIYNSIIILNSLSNNEKLNRNIIDEGLTHFPGNPYLLYNRGIYRKRDGNISGFKRDSTQALQGLTNTERFLVASNMKMSISNYRMDTCQFMRYLMYNQTSKESINIDSLRQSIKLVKSICPSELQRTLKFKNTQDLENYRVMLDTTKPFKVI